MRFLFITLCLVASAVSAQKSPAPELPGPKLRFTDSLKIDGTKAKLESPLMVAVGPQSQVVVRSSYRTMQMFDSAGRRRWSIDLYRGGEIADATAIGWRGSELWVSDGAFAQIALFDDYGHVTQSLELPSFVRPVWADRKMFPVFGRMDVYAIKSDGSMVVVPRKPHELVGTQGYDENSTYVLRVSEDGIIRNTIARFPQTDRYLSMSGFDRFRIGTTVSLGFRPRFRVSPDGARTVVVTTDTTGKTADTIVVTALGEKGDTVFKRKIAYAAKILTTAQFDSMTRGSYGRMDSETRDRLIKETPKRVAPLVNVTLGRDYTIWLTLRATATVMPIIGIDAAGQIIGTVYAPPSFSVGAADRTRIWGTDSKAKALDVVRYTVKP